MIFFTDNEDGEDPDQNTELEVILNIQNQIKIVKPGSLTQHKSCISVKIF